MKLEEAGWVVSSKTKVGRVYVAKEQKPGGDPGGGVTAMRVSPRKYGSWGRYMDDQSETGYFVNLRDGHLVRMLAGDDRRWRFYPAEAKLVVEKGRSGTEESSGGEGEAV